MSLMDENNKLNTDGGKVNEAAEENMENLSEGTAETTAENTAETAAEDTEGSEAADTSSLEESPEGEPAETVKEKKKHEKKPAPPTDKKSLKNGSYFLGITGIVIVAIIIINMIVGAIPTNFTKLDITANKMYSIGNTTKGVLSTLSQDVTIYRLTASGNDDATLTRLLDSYKAASSHISVEDKDLNSNPTFAKQYTSETVATNSLIVVSGDKSRYIAYSTIYPSSSSYYSSSTTFDGEGQITSAIANVTSTTEIKAYYTSGHSEIALGTVFTDTLTKANITSTELNLLNSDVPDDCNCLIIFSPTADFTTEEAQKVITYLQNGGHAMIVSVASTTSMPNFESILSTFGVSHMSGYVIDNDSTHYTQLPVLLMPDKVSSSPVYDGLSDLNLVYAFAQGITTASDTTYTVTPILQTSSSSYSISLDTTTGTQADGDPQGPFDVAVSITGGDKDTKILYYTTPCAFNSDTLSSLLQSNVTLPDGDSKLLSNSINDLCDVQQSITVDSKSTALAYNTVNENTGMITRTIFMYVLPAAVLVVGFVLWMRRRKR